MATRDITLNTSDDKVYVGLSKTNMLFHQCVFELTDNAIAATETGEKALIAVALKAIPGNDSEFELFICDCGVGMSDVDLEKALDLGCESTTSSRLNEHGFGLKNALTRLSGENSWWQIWTRKKHAGNVVTVEGPFKKTMKIVDESTTKFPSEPFVMDETSTVVKTIVKLEFAQTIQGRGARCRDLASIRLWLVEHLGVAYRGYLSLDPSTGETKAKICVFVGADSKNVMAIGVPMASATTKYIDVELGGTPYRLEYTYGTLDEVKRDALVYGEKAKYYYQGNQSTQGIDIRLGDRVIATRQLETIWRASDNPEKPISRHNSFNDFVGELRIPELPRGVLTTINNKTDFNLDDPDWIKIFDKMNERAGGMRPTETPREKSEAKLKKDLLTMLKGTNPSETIDDEHSVWNTGVRIDIYRENASGEITIYELKVGGAKPIHLYQLKMYWDGLILESKKPKEGILLVEDYSTAISAMASQMNTLTPPKMPDGKDGPAYNFKIKKHCEVGL